jgi:hypothetical protein
VDQLRGQLNQAQAAYRSAYLTAYEVGVGALVSKNEQALTAAEAELVTALARSAVKIEALKSAADRLSRAAVRHQDRHYGIGGGNRGQFTADDEVRGVVVRGRPIPDPAK